MHAGICAGAGRAISKDPSLPRLLPNDEALWEPVRLTASGGRPVQTGSPVRDWMTVRTAWKLLHRHCRNRADLEPPKSDGAVRSWALRQAARGNPVRRAGLGAREVRVGRRLRGFPVVLAGLGARETRLVRLGP